MAVDLNFSANVAPYIQIMGSTFKLLAAHWDTDDHKLSANNLEQYQSDWFQLIEMLR